MQIFVYLTARALVVPSVPGICRLISDLLQILLNYPLTSLLVLLVLDISKCKAMLMLLMALNKLYTTARALVIPSVPGIDYKYM